VCQNDSFLTLFGTLLSETFAKSMLLSSCKRRTYRLRPLQKGKKSEWDLTNRFYGYIDNNMRPLQKTLILRRFPGGMKECVGTLDAVTTPKKLKSMLLA